jgi:hypothetical protein
MLRSWLCALALGASLLPAVADAQEVTRRRPAIDLTMAAGFAKVVYQRSFYNAGDDGQLFESLRVPEGGVVTGFRLKTLGGAWKRGHLVNVESVQENLLGMGPDGGEAAVVTLSGMPQLQLLPFPASTTRTVEYTVLVPTTYSAGRHVLFNPALESEGDAGVLQAQGVRGKLLVDGVGASGGALEGQEIQLAPRAQPTLGGALADVELASGRHALRYRIELAPQLSSLPKNAYVVVLLDASRSLGANQGQAALAGARAFLSHLPDAKVEIITFDRSASSVSGGFIDAANATAFLTTLGLSRSNGSDVGAALALAKRRLAQAPAGSPKRVLLFTDALVASQVDPHALGLGTTGGLLHLALPDDLAVALERDDEHPWASDTAASGGVVWKAHADPAGDTLELRRTYEELARPIRLHHAKLSVPEAPDLADQVDAELLEGRGLSGLAWASGAVSEVSLRGELWQATAKLTLKPEPRETKLWQTLLLGSPLEADMTDGEVRALASRSRVLSRMTAFVAVTPGSRPDAFSGLGLSGFSSSSCCCCGGWRGATGIGHIAHPAEHMARELARAYVFCGGTTEAVEVGIETTFAEIVSVTTSSSDAALASCVEGRTWAVLLPDGFGRERDTWSVSLPLPPQELPQ